MRRVVAAVERGFTLIELMVVVAIIAVLMVVGAVALGAIRGADVDATGSTISGVMTYLSSRAVHDNKTYRLVLDMGEKRFWSETINEDDPCARFIPEEAEAGVAAATGKPKERGEAEAAREDEDDEGAVEDGPFTTAEGPLMRRKFEPDTNVTAVLTSHHTEPQTEGRAAIYFYPNGQAERALVWVGGKASPSESPTGFLPEITIELHSLGRVTFHGDTVDAGDFDLQAPEEL